VWRQLNDEHLADGALQACFFDTKASITFGFVQDCRPYVQHDVSDLDFAEAIAPILVEINKSINLMESDTDINGSSFYEETKRLMHLAIDNISSTRSDLCAFSRSLLISLVEQISGRRLDNFGNEIGCKVPLRFSEKDFAAIYLSPKSCFVDFNSVSKRLEEDSKINV
jgi:hypothetical protein